MQVQYVVDCARNKLNMVAWKMFSQREAKGELVWADQSTDVNYRYAPGTDEEKAVVGNLCGASVASR